MRNITNTFYLLLMLAISLLGFTSCDDDDEGESVVLDLVSDVHATDDSGIAYFDLEGGTTLTQADSNSTTWDIAFNGSTIMINGGTSGPGEGAAQIVEGIFETITSAPTSGYSVDSADGYAIPSGSGNGWYTYTAMTEPQHAILPIPGVVIVLKTGEGNYVKVEIISYYEGNPDTSTDEFADLSTRPSSQYYTFQYAVQTNGGIEF